MYTLPKKFMDLELKTHEILLQFNLQYLITLDMSFNHFIVIVFVSNITSVTSRLLSRLNENNFASVLK